MVDKNPSGRTPSSIWNLFQQAEHNVCRFPNIHGFLPFAIYFIVVSTLPVLLHAVLMCVI